MRVDLPDIDDSDHTVLLTVTEEWRLAVAYQLTVLYHPPTDPRAFNTHYDEVHTPLAAKLPGLRGFTISHPAGDGTVPTYHLVAVLVWDTKEDMDAAFDSPDGHAAVADLENFASAGVTMLSGPSTIAV